MRKAKLGICILGVIWVLGVTCLFLIRVAILDGVTREDLFEEGAFEKRIFAY